MHGQKNNKIKLWYTLFNFYLFRLGLRPPPGISDSPLISPSFSSGQRNRAYWALGSTQPLTEMGTLNFSLGVKATGAYG